MAGSEIKIGFDEETKELIRDLFRGQLPAAVRYADGLTFGIDRERNMVYAAVEPWRRTGSAGMREVWLNPENEDLHWVDPMDTGSLATARDSGLLRLFVEKA